MIESEIQEINTNSKLVKKYSELIDRESAYEILNKKIAEAQTQAAEQKQSEKAQKKTASEPMSPVAKGAIKVLTSATFIRGVFGVLSKIFKK
ncbi:hypothetical protein D3C80_1719550 [compost metagenome]